MNQSIGARRGGTSNDDAYRQLRRNHLRDERTGALTRRDDAFERHFNRYGPGGMSGFHGTRGDVETSEQRLHREAWKKGLKTVANTTKDQTLGQMFDEFSKDLLEGEVDPEDHAGAKALDDARKTFAKSLAKHLFKL